MFSRALFAITGFNFNDQQIHLRVILSKALNKKKKRIVGWANSLSLECLPFSKEINKWVKYLRFNFWENKTTFHCFHLLKIFRLFFVFHHFLFSLNYFFLFGILDTQITVA